MEIKLQLPCGRAAIIDEADAVLVAPYRWISDVRKTTVYVRGRLPRQASGGVYLHRLLTGNAMTDHRDGNGLNNRRQNLRPCSQQENCLNSRPKRAGKFKGVFFDKRRSRWYVQLYKDRICYFGGSYDTPLQAAIAYDRLALRRHGSFARLNFSDRDL